MNTITLLLLLSLSAKVDAIFAEYDRTDSPGCAVGVFQDGRIEYTRGYGMANLEHALANSPQTVFDIGSTSKQFTVFAVLLLEADGKLSIDDDVRKYVPELYGYGPTITIRQLMQHTSGLRDYLGLFWLRGIETEDLTTDEDALEVIVRQETLNFEPGSEYLYSNSGYFLLSQIVKRVSGKTLSEFAEERIFAPLSMRHSRFHGDHRRIVPRRATGYDEGENGDFVIDMSDYEQTGDGAVYTTIEDLFLWDQNFYQPKVGTAEMLERMQTKGKLSNGEPIDYGLGLTMREIRGLKTVSHGGSWAGYRAQLLRFPEERLSVACLCNLGATNPSELARKVAEVVLAEKMTPETRTESAERTQIELTPDALKAFAGTFWEKNEGYAFVSASETRLVADVYGSRIELAPISATTFFAEIGVDVEFEGLDRMVVRAGSQEPVTYERIETWTPGDVSEFAGLYESGEIGATLEIVHEDGALRARHRTIPDDPFRPTRTDSFAVAGLELRFTRDGGRVSGFTLDMGRVKGIRYERIR
jgi:CubicO group peptidase (beta-lactamase class C family)